MTTEIQAWKMEESALIAVLADSLYAGAPIAHVKMVLGYCKAAGLDPMQKPVHLVPMRCKVGENPDGSAKYGWRTTVWPGIGLYRTQAASTGEYAGQDKATFGPTKTLTYRKKIWRDRKEEWIEATLEYPEWCEVTVYRIVQGIRCAYTAQEFWIENYATASSSTNAPNEMWETRVHGQIKKCAEAQALRMAFPNSVGAQPTADEMEGKELVVDMPPAPPAEPKRQPKEDPPPPAAAEPPASEMPPEPPAEGSLTKATPAPSAPSADAQPPAPPAEETGEIASDGERKFLLNKAKRGGADVRALLDSIGCQHVQADTLAGLSKAKWTALKGLL